MAEVGLSCANTDFAFIRNVTEGNYRLCFHTKCYDVTMLLS
jgi:hypothetical protein